MVTFPRPQEGLLLLTVEGSRGIIQSRASSTLEGREETGEIQHPDDPADDAQRLRLPVPDPAAPRRPPTTGLSGCTAWSPFRVEDPRSRQELVISTAELIRPNQPFTVDMRTGRRPPHPAHPRPWWTRGSWT